MEKNSQGKRLSTALISDPHRRRVHGNCLALELQSVHFLRGPQVLRDFGELEMFKHLLLQLLSELLGLVLLVVVHNHHGGIDLPNGHVAG